MKFFHLSDLHFGRQLHGYSLYMEQKEFIKQLSKYIKEEKPDAVLFSGDIYDKAVPAGQAVALLDEMLVSLDNIPSLIISGNHDCAERLQYGRSFLEKHNIYISVLPPQKEDERLKKVILKDQYGNVCFYMLPFIKPGMVRHFMPDAAAGGEYAVIKALLEKEDIDFSGRNVILSHQFYKNGSHLPERSDSEQKAVSVGGTDEIDISVLNGFDYAALGHIHKAQQAGKQIFRYCGTPLKYSVSEAGQDKSITVVEMGTKKDGIHIRTLPVKPLHDVLKLRGGLGEIISFAKENKDKQDDYVSITITDDDIPEMAKEQLQGYFPNILEIIADNERTRQILSEEAADFKELSPYEAFAVFFKEMTGRGMDNKESSLLKEVIEEALKDRPF